MTVQVRAKNLTNLLSDGGTIVAMAYSARVALRFISNIVLTRLLYPEAFGLMAIISSVLFVLELSSDFGFRAFVIRQPRGAEKAYLDTLWTVRIIRGIILSAILAGCAYPISQFYGYQELLGALLVISMAVAIRGFESTAYFTAQRDQRFLKVSLLELSIQVIQLIVAVGLALVLKNYWALVCGSVVATTTSVFMSYLAFPGSSRQFRIDAEAWQELWAFSRIIMPSSILTIVITQADKLIIAKAFNIEVLGIYAIAVTMTQLFSEFAQNQNAKVIFPRLAEKMRNAPTELKQTFYRERGRYIPIFLFVSGICVPLGPIFFDVIFDDRYLQGGALFSILMAKPILSVTSSVCTQCLVIKGRIVTSLNANILRAVWFILSVYPLYDAFGLYGLVASVAMIEVFPVLYLWRKLNEEGLLDIGKEVTQFFFIGGGLSVGFLISNMF